MHKISVFRAVLITLLGLLWATGGVAAAPPAQEGPSDEVSAQAAVSTAFTYQGNLEDSSGPANGAYDFEFTLFDALTNGSPVGLTQTKTGQTVTAGLFSLQLDFGNQFDGTALWLQINVRTAGDPAGYTPLSPRQPLTATPYAIYALNVPTHDHWGETWTGTGTGLTLSGGTTGLKATGTTYGVRGETTSTTGYAVSGLASASTGSTRGVSGETASTAGLGVFGNAYATSGSTIGVYGQNSSPDGKAVQGDALATSGTTYGVYGSSSSPSGRGVFGNATAATGSTRGVSGQSASSSGGIGVYGLASATAGTNYGMLGQSASTSGEGVHGQAYATTGTTYGVYGESASSTGRGVYGRATQTTGVNYGVQGRSDSSQGYGVYGDAPNTTGVSYGVYGRNSSTSGTGVYGFANAASGVTTGVYGISNSSTGYGVHGKNVFGGYAGWFEGTVHVNGGGKAYNPGGYGFLNSGGAGTSSSSSKIYDIYAAGEIAATEFNAFSDARIKNIQGRSAGATDLTILNQIEITDYTFKDVIGKGNDPLKKVIGQQVETVYPQAVHRSTDVVPDIYQQAPIEDGWVELATDLQVGERVRLIGKETQGVYEVLEVTAAGFRTDFVADSEAVFVYGREVNDFRSVDYEAIGMLNVSATQELNRLVEQQAAEIEALNTRLAALEQTATGNAASNGPLSPWLLVGGLGVVGLAFVQQRRTGG